MDKPKSLGPKPTFVSLTRADGHHEATDEENVARALATLDAHRNVYFETTAAAGRWLVVQFENGVSLRVPASGALWTFDPVH